MRKTLCGAATACMFAAFLGAAAAHGDPQGCPQGAIVDESGCSARLTAVSADSTNGTITGTPAGGRTPITIFGEPDFYLPSTGFANTPPDAVQQWDAAIERVKNANPSDPGWYGQGKTEAFLPRQLNDLATRFPPNTLEVRFGPDDSDPRILRLRSLQPTG